jgi:adenosylmethionine-8-amino-7-oxononanoate aminotransferase
MMHLLAKLDHAHVWHPFTQMRDWLKREPIVIVKGRGALLFDVNGREYLDANSSIWTNLHGHNHPRINAAIQRQLKKVAHSSALGLANEPASLLARRLVDLANGPLTIRGPRGTRSSRALGDAHRVSKVFFSDDGSTALEVALKLAHQFTQRLRGPKSTPRFVSLQGGYHGDTVGAVSLGQIDLIHRPYSSLLFKTDRLMAPYCYRCPFNRAKPERADARSYRKCNWECTNKAERVFKRQVKTGNPYAGFVFEPLIQGAAGMIPQPSGWLRQVTDLARAHGALLLADEVMTGFGRIDGAGEAVEGNERRNVPANSSRTDAPAHLFACQVEDVRPDFLCAAKGLTGGYLPMAATLTTHRIFDAFLGEYAEFKAFFHGHSYTANQLGASASLASLDLLHSTASSLGRRRLCRLLHEQLEQLWSLPNVGDIRQVGSIVGVELVRNWRTREPFGLAERVGPRVCEAMARRGVLTRPIGDVVVLMPPFCTTVAQIRKMVQALAESVSEVLPKDPL